MSNKRLKLTQIKGKEVRTTSHEEQKRVVTGNILYDYYNNPPSWSFNIWDYDHERWGLQCRTVEELAALFTYLRTREGQTWKEIMYAHAKHGTASHYIEISRINPEAQKRIEELHLNDNSLLLDAEVFSMRFTGTLRLWGAIDVTNGTFHIIWYDPEHEIYQVEKKHT